MNDASQTQKNLLIISHSQSGKTQAMSRAVLQGCQQEPTVTTLALHARDADLQNLLWAHAVLFGTPENFGTMSGMLKDFFDRTFYPAQPYQLNLPYALFIGAGNDGTGASKDIQRIAKGYPLRQVSDPVICRGDLDASHLSACNDLGLTMAMGLEMGIF